MSLAKIGSVLGICASTLVLLGAITAGVVSYVNFRVDAKVTELSRVMAQGQAETQRLLREDFDKNFQRLLDMMARQSTDHSHPVLP